MAGESQDRDSDLSSLAPGPLTYLCGLRARPRVSCGPCPSVLGAMAAQRSQSPGFPLCTLQSVQGGGSGQKDPRLQLPQATPSWVPSLWCQPPHGVALVLEKFFLARGVAVPIPQAGRSGFSAGAVGGRVGPSPLAALGLSTQPL